jgi:hypothetical protein
MQLQKTELAKNPLFLVALDAAFGAVDVVWHDHHSLC